MGRSTCQIAQAVNDAFSDFYGLAQPAIVKALLFEQGCVGGKLGELLAGQLAAITYHNEWVLRVLAEDVHNILTEFSILPVAFHPLTNLR